MRLFIGIPLADAVMAELAEVCARLRSAVDGLRWATPETWHITLQFLGNATAEQHNCLAARLAGVASPPVPIHLTALGVFDRAGILYAGVDLAPALIWLQQRVVAATAPCGFQPENRPFHPHITLARTKGQNRARQLAGLMAKLRVHPEFTPFTAREFLLYESHLSAQGSRYDVRARFPL